MSLALHQHEGKAVWALGELHIWKATGADTGGQYALMEDLVAAGGEPPPHVHHNEDEAFYVLSGEVTFQLGEQEFSATQGAFVFGPRGVPHAFRVTSAEPARMLVIVSPSGFDDFSAELGKPAGALTLPPAEAPDFEKLARLTQKYRIDILPPPA